jgi:diguanylate cyclase (GGDEF)-like protein/PAS domain S-box-containing protein
MEQARDIILVVATDGQIIDANQAASTAYGYSLEELREICVHDLRSPETRIAVDAQIKRAQQEGILFRSFHMRKNGDRFPVEVSSRRFQLIKGEAIVSIVRDITDAIASETEILQQNMILTALHKTAMGLMHRHDPEDLLNLIVASATELVGTPHGFIYRLDKQKGIFYQSHGLGTFEGNTRRDMPIDQGVAGTVFRTGQPVIANDFREWRRRYPASAQFEELCSVLQIPLKSAGEVIGIIGLAYCEAQNAFGRNELEIVSRLAELASIALDNASLIRTMSRMAYYDSLTGLPNRSYLQERLTRELASARRGEAAGAVLFIGLDDLKMINDTLGHAYGDRIIVKAGACILAAAGDHSVVARIGGDEFIVLLANESNQEKVGCLADTMVKLLSRDYEIGESPIHMSASIGVAVYPSDGNTTEDILKSADLALSAAKSNGKNTWRFYERSLQTIAYENMMLKSDLREAIERGELALHYQPLVNASSGCVIGFEALLRWTSSEHGPVPPSRFIPLAEESDTIQKIGKWVIEEACRFARKLAAMGRDDLRIGVNVSPRQLVADDFVASACKAIDSAGIKPNQLEFEITENALIDSLEDSKNKFRELRALGVGLSLDDFGTGYSSLTYLRGLPVGILKLDKSFIDPIVADEAQLQFISAIVDMAHVLRLAVVAEGVESEEQLKRLVSCRCDFIQGYLFSRPLPENEAILYLDRPKTETARDGAS